MGGSRHVCYVGMAPSSSKFYPRCWNGTFLAWLTKRSAMLEAPSSSTLYPCVAHTRSALLEWPFHLYILHWHLPPLNVSSGASQKVCYLGMAPSSSKCHNQVAHKWAAVLNGSYLLFKFYPQVAHKRSATLEWVLALTQMFASSMAPLPWNRLS